MKENLERLAAQANAALYDSVTAGEYRRGAPHLKHAVLGKLFAELAGEVYQYAAQWAPAPKVLDLGAADGTASALFLELGAEVTAVDVSQKQLEALRAREHRQGERLQLRCQSAQAVLEEEGPSYDVVMATSFLHHIPDYLGLVAGAVRRLTRQGQFFFFQDPLRYDSLPRPTLAFSQGVYYMWRLWQPDRLGGLKRWLRRQRGVYLPHCVEDNVEYHGIRNGVDQEALTALLRGQGFDCRLVRYFSTQSALFQALGSRLGLENTFALIARRRTQASHR